jgi:hypothetical protein
MMIAVFDEGLQRIVTSLNQSWTEIRARKRGFDRRDEMSFVTDAIMLAGVKSLLCCVDVKDLPDPEVEYYPIYLKLVDPLGYAPEEWLTLARKGGQSNFERQVQWLFNKPSLRLLKRDEDIADSIRPDARKDVLQFYGGLELMDPFSRKTLKIEADDLGDFVVHVKFVC